MKLQNMKTNKAFLYVILIISTIISNTQQLTSQTFYWEFVPDAIVNGDTMCYAFSGGLPPFYAGYPIYEYGGNPTFFDVNLDGDLDFFFAGYNSNIAYYENTNNNGTNYNPCWDLVPKLLPGVSTPIGMYGTLGCQSPFFVDIDGDGEFDLISSGGGGGGEGGTIYYFRDTIIGDDFQFVLEDTMLAGINAYDFGDPCAQDVDNDGDIDIIIGDGWGDIYFCRNKGNNQWADPVLIYDNDSSYYPLHKATPTLGDLDNDGLSELLVGSAYGSIRLFKIDSLSLSNDTVVWTLTDPDYLNLGFNQNYPFGPPFNIPILLNFSNNFILDLFIVNRGAGFLSYYKNIGDVDSAIWDMPQNYQFTIDVSNGNLSMPVIDYVDVNGDSLNDIVLSILVPNSNLSLGDIIVYENHGDENNPNWVLTTYNLLENLLSNYTYITGMCFYDVVGDFLPDLFLSIDSSGHEKILLFQNNTSSGDYQFDYVNNMSLESIDSTISIEIGDINLNGKPDLLVTIYGSSGNLQWYEKTNDGWELVTNDLLTTSNYNYAEIADFDYDGLPDIIATDNLDNFSFYKNLGVNQSVPIFERQTPTNNYFQGITTSGRKPIWGNIDGKCGNDLVIGGIYGGVYVWGFRGIKPSIVPPATTSYEICDASEVVLEGKPSGGTWSGSADSTGTFTPSGFPSTGNYWMVYSYKDPEGCFTKSDSLLVSIIDCTVAASEIPMEEDNLTVSPNPAEAMITIKYAVKGGRNVRITLVDILGQEKSVIYRGNDFEENSLDWQRPENLEAGLYVVVLSTERGIMGKKVMLK